MGRFDWNASRERFACLTTPDASYHGLVYTERFGEEAYIARCRSVLLRTTGAVLPAMSAFMLLQGLETVAIRVERHVQNARAVADFLRGSEMVEWVNYTGFSENPYHGLVQRYMGGPRLFASNVRHSRRLRGWRSVLQSTQAGQAAREHWRREISSVPSRFHNTSADVGRRAAGGRRAARDDKA